MRTVEQTITMSAAFLRCAAVVIGVLAAQVCAQTPQGFVAPPTQQPPSTPPQVILAEDFEAPATSRYTVVRAGQSLRTHSNTWMVESGSIDIVNTRAMTSTAAFNGVQGIDLAGSPGPGVMSTSFATTPGQSYQLSFHYSRNNGVGATPARARVEVVGNAVLLRGEVQHAAPQRPFNAQLQYRGSFRADGPRATLRFTSLNGGNAGVMLDAIQVATAPKLVY